MIPLHKFLKHNKIGKTAGKVLDLGGGDGTLSLPFLKEGCSVTLVDFSQEVLDKAKEKFDMVEDANYSLINKHLKDFEFGGKCDYIIINHVLPFLKKGNAERLINQSFEHLNDGGVLFFSLFGPNDDWAIERKDTMIFYNKEEASSILSQKARYVSEDYFEGFSRKGIMKNSHVFYFLYIKEK